MQGSGTQTSSSICVMLSHCTKHMSPRLQEPTVPSGCHWQGWKMHSYETPLLTDWQYSEGRQGWSLQGSGTQTSSTSCVMLFHCPKHMSPWLQEPMVPFRFHMQGSKMHSNEAPLLTGWQYSEARHGWFLHGSGTQTSTSSCVMLSHCTKHASPCRQGPMVPFGFHMQGSKIHSNESPLPTGWQ